MEFFASGVTTSDPENTFKHTRFHTNSFERKRKEKFKTLYSLCMRFPVAKVTLASPSKTVLRLTITDCARCYINHCTLSSFANKVSFSFRFRSRISDLSCSFVHFLT